MNVYIPKYYIIMINYLKKISNYSEINLPIVAKGEFSSDKKKKILFLKQTVFQDLYCCKNYNSYRDLIFSSLKRTGPVGLFTRLNADFIIVNLVHDIECNIWQQKWYDCKQKPPEFYLSLIDTPFLGGKRGHLEGQGKYGIDINDIDFSKYDIVISCDISVPTRIVKQNPHIVWCYYISEPCMTAYKKSHQQVLFGYDLFLNEGFRKIKLNPKPRWHEIEFPYFLQYYGCFHDLLGIDKDFFERAGIFLESHTSRELDADQINELKSFGPLGFTEGKTEEIIMGLLKSKYYVRFGGRKLWGNSMIEAIAAGCLALGNPDEFRHVSLFTNKTSVKSFEELTKRIKFFEGNPDEYSRELRKQRRRLDYVCYNRPLRELYKKSDIIFSARKS